MLGLILLTSWLSQSYMEMEKQWQRNEKEKRKTVIEMKN